MTEPTTIEAPANRWRAILHDQYGYVHDDPEEALKQIFADEEDGRISIVRGTALPTADEDGEEHMPGTWTPGDHYIEFDLDDYDTLEDAVEAWRRAQAAAAGLNGMAELERLRAELVEAKQRRIGEMKRRLAGEREVIDAAKAWRELIIGDREYRSLTLDPVNMALADAVDALADSEAGR
jgi:hypothetical protein